MSVADAIFPVIEGWPEMLDIVLGTVDREDSEGDTLVPERQLRWACGIGWVRRIVSEGVGWLLRHPGWRVDEFID